MPPVTLTTLEKELRDFREDYNKGILDMSGVMVEFQQMKEMMHRHDKILVTGNGSPSMQEEIRTIKKFIESLQKWMTIIAIAFIGQFAAVGVTIIVVLIQALPYLKMIAAAEIK